MRVLPPAVALSALFLYPQAVWSQPTVPAPAPSRTAMALQVDGEPTDADWTRAVPLTELLEREPDEGTQPSLPTEIRVAFNASALFVSIHAVDPDPDRIVGYLTRRDDSSRSDWIHVFVDSYHDRRTAYSFSVNAAGVKQDAYWFNDDSNDNSWDAVWDVSVARDSTGWRAQFRIPYSQLRFSPGGNGTLGFAVARVSARLNETYTWPLIARSATGFVSQFGDLAGVATDRESKRLEIVPYTVAQLVTRPPEDGNPLHQTADPGASVGMDVKYALTPALSLTATVNPDFGQVEADPAVVNLGAFETFFQEKRPFFIEGSGTYQFGCDEGCNLFYSRRIGRAPRGTFTDDGHAVTPTQSTILGAGKVTGRAGGFSLGVLAAATQEERARIALGSERRSQIVEPFTLYSVSRARREFADQSSIGFMVTTTNRHAVEATSFLPGTAVTGGVDYDARLGSRFRLNGYWAGSDVRGTPGAIDLLQRSNVHSYQRPDATHLSVDPAAESMRGHAGAVAFSKISGERIRFNTQIAYKSPGFEVNDAGFMRRADEVPQNSWLQIRSERPGPYLRQWYLNFNQWSNHNFAGDRLGLGANINAHTTFLNNWSTGGGVSSNARVFDDRHTRGGPGAYLNPNVSMWHYVNTDDRGAVSFGLNWSFFTNGHSRGFDVGPSISLRPTPSLSAEFGVFFNPVREDAQWVEQETDAAGRERYVFARMEQTTTSMTARATYTLTPNLTLQVYAQPFVSAGEYSGFRELVDGRALRHADRYAPYAYGGDPDFRVLSFRTTNVLRWEFRPGSTVFVVWQQGREGFAADGSFRFGRDYRDVFATPATNAVLVKLAYWVNP